MPNRHEPLPQVMSRRVQKIDRRCVCGVFDVLGFEQHADGIAHCFIIVNDVDARALRDNFAEWEVTLPKQDTVEITAFARDAAGNIEKQSR